MEKLGNNRRYSGFVFIEIIIALVLLGIITKFGYSSYSSFQIRENRELAKHDLVVAAAAMEKYYNQEGCYTESSGATSWPIGLFESKVYGGSGLVYRLQMATGTPNSQNFYVVAIPESNTIQANDGNICIDKAGQFTWPSSLNCGLAVAEPPPPPPANLCLGAVQQSACSSGCVAGRAYQACSGNCGGVLICDGTYPPTGCSGICNNTYIYVRTGTLVGNAACNGNCRGATFNVPYSWMNRTPACNITNGGSTANCICNTASNGSCEGIKIVYH